MRTAPVLAIAAVVGACERPPADDPTPRVAPAPAVARTRTPPAPPRPPVTRIPEEALVPPAEVPAGYPMPPSDEPTWYAAWLRALPRADQQRIDRYCRAHKLDYQYVCGGIGPLHVPYPPFPRAFRHPTWVVRRWPMSYDAWDHMLSAAQRRYVDRSCVGGEMRPSSDLCGDNTPLVVAFDRRAVAFAPGARLAFAPGAAMATDWPTAATPWIAIDLDGNGAIDSGAELFGSNTMLPDGMRASNGFIALAALDANHDGVIDRRDPAFASLVLWFDRDGDGRSTPDELVPLASMIESISLAATDEPRCDTRGNCERERAPLVWRDGAGTHAGAVIDVHLPARVTASW
jgi:hypothetical protein